MSHGRELLAARRELPRVDRRPRRGRRDEPLGVLALHPLGALQVQEVPQGALPERQQLQLQPGG
ncbi:MAG TPA: hypothetical protein VHN80_29195, partial [Kineosporiaceae bacterium]|nr:hypothetical protein [Kineosporiaceae bacterium]